MYKYSGPGISIITVVYNEATPLRLTIQSVLAQREHPIEYIVIDGGSTDGTVDVLRQYNSEITYWISEKDQGIYDAMNKGWAKAQADNFILFLGAGDEIVSLPKTGKAFSTVDVLYGQVERETGDFSAKVDYRLRMVNTLHHQGMLVRRSIHPAAPFDIRFRTYADFDFNQRLYSHGARFAFSDELIARAMPGGLSSRHYIRESLSIVRKNFGVFWMCLALLYYLAYYAVRPGICNISLQNTVRRLSTPLSQTGKDW